jgi:hypothetical protein
MTWQWTSDLLARRVLHSLTLNLLLSVSCREGCRLAVAIRAKHPKIFEPVIVPNAVTMVELDRQRFASPAAKATLIAHVL